MKYNIFQGNQLLLRKVANVWGYNLPDDELRGSMTSDIFYESFFYLTQRFGAHQKHDEYKDAGIWSFEVDEYIIQILLNTSWVIVMMFGNEKHKDLSVMSPYWRRKSRRMLERREDYVNMWSDDKTEKENEIMGKQWEVFCSKHGIDDTWAQEKYDKEKKYMDWFKHMEAYNEEVLDVDFKEMAQKYGRNYKNRQIKKALRVLEKFLKNMLVPVSVRDCNYNIKGMCGNEYDKYIDNIEIKFLD